MERHQNSLHLRPQSWSCSSLQTPQAAFYREETADGEPAFDCCGYCGQNFTNPPNYVERQAHVITTHKFGECNHQKKFYRADHFRQHLKHSHGGTSGKWTNQLEQACMREEAASPGPAA